MVVQTSNKELESLREALKLKEEEHADKVKQLERAELLRKEAFQRLAKDNKDQEVIMVDMDGDTAKSSMATSATVTEEELSAVKISLKSGLEENWEEIQVPYQAYVKEEELSLIHI
eukprot:14608597-Alexandrium_andersonii.AAC.1